MSTEEAAGGHYLAYLTYLLNTMSVSFDIEDIETLCFNLGIEYDDLSGDTKRGKCRSLIQTLRHRDALPSLEDYLAKERPNKVWNYWSWWQTHQPEVEGTEQQSKSSQTNFEGDEIDDSYLSTQLRAQLFAVGKAIEQLTTDQYKVIRWLNGHRRAAIPGCAGSGKTLVAVEKAMRLDSAGLRTLFLTHSPYLANFIKQLTSHTSIQVFDFASWVMLLNGKRAEQDQTWTHLIEPTDDELDQAFDSLTRFNNTAKYEAVIVDEGQDFRETWWLIIEEALIDSQTGILYIFHDDNQSLLPQRGKYPVDPAPIVLSKNCRNAGHVFEFVRRFHAQAPESSVNLSNYGVVRESTFTRGKELETVEDAVRSSLKVVNSDQLVVLTTEMEPVTESILNGLQIQERPQWRWQDSVRIYLGTKLPLSDAPYPTAGDISIVSRFARNMIGTSTRASKLLGDYTFDWRVKDETKLILISYPRGMTFNMMRFAAFFASETWSDSIPKPAVYKLTTEQSSRKSSEVQLFTTASFKGLEADGIVLFIRSQRDELNANMYVGCSRARFLLHIVVDEQVYARNAVLQSEKYP